MRHMETKTMKTADLVAKIESLGTIQDSNPPSSAEWQLASENLQPLFAEMAQRQQANGGERDWHKWQ
jgi:hypothetical protein